MFWTRRRRIFENCYKRVQFRFCLPTNHCCVKLNYLIEQVLLKSGSLCFSGPKHSHDLISYKNTVSDCWENRPLGRKPIIQSPISSIHFDTFSIQFISSYLLGHDIRRKYETILSYHHFKLSSEHRKLFQYLILVVELGYFLYCTASSSLFLLFYF